MQSHQCVSVCVCVCVLPGALTILWEAQLCSISSILPAALKDKVVLGLSRVGCGSEGPRPTVALLSVGLRTVGHDPHAPPQLHPSVFELPVTPSADLSPLV